MARKATRAGLKEHNRRLILRAIYEGEAGNRAALATYTGLAKPTVSDIVADLMAEGLLVEEGFGESTESGGKRPRLLQFAAAARQVIGISVDGARAVGALANLDGRVLVRHEMPLRGARGDDALIPVAQVVNALNAQRQVPLQCIAVGTPGVVDTQTGVVKSSRALGWHNYPLAARLSHRYNVPAYVGNNTELATRAQFAFSADEQVDHLVTLLANSELEIGIAFGGLVYHHSSGLGALRSNGESETFAARLNHEAIAARLAVIAPDHPLRSPFRYLRLQYAYVQGDSAAGQLYSEIASDLAQVFAWVVALLRPDQIVLAGELADLGLPLVHLAAERVSELLPPVLFQSVTFAVSKDALLNVTGAIALALERGVGVL